MIFPFKKLPVFVMALMLAASLSAPACAAHDNGPRGDHQRKEFNHERQKPDHDGKFEKERHDRKEMRGDHNGKDLRKPDARGDHNGDPRQGGKKHN